MAGQIKGITIEFRGDTTKLDKALRQVNNETKGVDRELRNVNRALKFNPGSVDLWRQKQTLLTQRVAETKQKLDALKQAQRQADTSGIDKNSAEYRELQRDIIETESKLKHFQGELRKVGNAKLTALGEQFKSVGKKMTDGGKSMTQKVTLPIAGVATVAAKKFADVDKVMQLTNSTMGNSRAEADLLNKAMKSAAASSTFGMNDAATATLNFARSGLSAKQAADALAPAMALAAGEGGELDTVSAGLVSTINGFHGSFADAGKYADVFANACNNSALDVNSLSDAMGTAAPIFSSAGYSVQDAALYMGVMANNGIEADRAANSLKTGLARLVSPAKDGAAMMEKLGISVTNSDGSMKDSVTVQKELHDAFGKLSESEQIAAASAIFGKNQMAPWLALINTAPGDVNSLNAALGENGTALKMQSDMMKGFGGSIEKLKSGLDVLLTSLGEALAPIIMKVAGWIQKLVDWFNNLSPRMQSIVAVVMVVVAAIGPLLVIFGTLASAIGSIISLVSTLAPLFGAMAGVIGAISGPVLIVIGVIAALIAIGVLLYKNWDVVKAKLAALKAWFISVWNAIKSATIKAFNAVKNAMLAPIRNAVTIIRALIDKIKKFFRFKVSLPHIKLPHFAISPKGWELGDLLKGSIPSLGIRWYAKGGIFDSPSVIGVGEAGPEAVVPIDKLNGMFSAMADSIVNGIATVMSMGQQGGNVTIPIYLYPSGPKMGEETVRMYDTYKKIMG